MLGIELIIVDECQNFKDASSERSKALVKFIEETKIKHKIFLSGTPIKNRASEYFVALNLLAPTIFNSDMQFKREWLIPNEKGIYTRIDPYRLEEFRTLISQWIIRREVKDVQKNLPKLTRDFQWFQIEDPIVKKSYNAEIGLFESFMRTASRIDSTTLLGWLARMRAITGAAKVPWALDYAEEFLESSDKSLILGIHHHTVRDTLYLKLRHLKPLKFSGEDNIYAKERIKNAFINQESRLMIMNMIAGGTGTDGLQKVCYSMVCLERQWSSADEEQFEKRINRDGQQYPCSVVYPIAKGTIDEWFYNLVEIKREILRETMGDSEASSYDPISDGGLLKELAEMTIANRL
jgi:non-specific serine/threonine protein kinase